MGRCGPVGPSRRPALAGVVSDSGAARRIGLLGGTFDPPTWATWQRQRRCAIPSPSTRSSLWWPTIRGRRSPPAPSRPPRTVLPWWLPLPRRSPGSRRAGWRSIVADRATPSRPSKRFGPSPAVAGRTEPEIYVVVGGDLVESLPTWHRVDDLRRLVTLAIVSRPRSPAPAAPPGWQSVLIGGRAVDVSSSEVRERLGRGEPVDGLVPVQVVRCILRRGLYAVGR